MPNETVISSNIVGNAENRVWLIHLPGFAAFIKNSCLIPYIVEQINISREINLPLLKFFVGVSDDQLVAMGMDSHMNFLSAVEENRIREHLEKSLITWKEDRLGVVKREEISAEDITLGTYVRKKAMMKFLSSYTSDVEEAICIIKEIDMVSVENDTAATNMYLNILNDRIDEQAENEREIARKLAESEKALLKATEIAHVGSWTWDLVTNVIRWSDELYKIYGIESDFELTFDKIMEFTNPEDRARIKHNMKISKETAKPSEAYYHITLLDGSQKALHSKTETVLDDEGNASMMLGIIQDVTEKQLLIERLQSSEQLYKQAQAISHMGNWSWNLNSQKLVWSDELYRIYELEPSEMPLDSGEIGKFNHPDDDHIVWRHIRHAIQKIEPFEFDYRIILQNGNIKTLNAKGGIKTDLNGAPSEIYGTLQDVTQRKKIEKQLRDYRAFINKITDVTPSIIAAYNIHSGKYSFINNAIEKMLGYPASRVMSEGAAFFMSIIHPDDLPSLVEKNSAALNEANQPDHSENESVVEFKYRMKNSSGTYRWFHTYGTVFERNSEGLVDSVLNVSVDITAQEEAEQELFRKNLRLQQSNSNLEEYAYVASHDLKEPLRKIATFADRLLSMQSELNSDGRIYLDKIIGSAIRMQQMISDLLSVSTIMGNNSFELSDLNILLNEALQSLDYRIEETHAKIESDKLPTVKVVPSQFRQLFQNLVNNSLKFSKKNELPEINITHEFINSSSYIPENLPKAKRYLKISITDNGIGFDNEYAGKIFAIFQRLHSKTEYEGTGIGLAICKKVVENHNGIILANGTPDKGATFTIIIPIL